MLASLSHDTVPLPKMARLLAIALTLHFLLVWISRHIIESSYWRRRQDGYMALLSCSRSFIVIPKDR